MKKFYHLFIVNSEGKATKYIDTVMSKNALSAELECINRFGMPRNYTGKSKDKFVAILA